MIAIPLGYILTGLVALLVGAAIAFPLGWRMGKHRLYELLIRSKNPELWEKAHFLKIEEVEEDTKRRERRAARVRTTRKMNQ